MRSLLYLVIDVKEIKISLVINESTGNIIINTWNRNKNITTERYLNSSLPCILKLCHLLRLGGVISASHRISTLKRSSRRRKSSRRCRTATSSSRQPLMRQRGLRVRVLRGILQPSYTRLSTNPSIILRLQLVSRSNRRRNNRRKTSSAGSPHYYRTASETHTRNVRSSAHRSQHRIQIGSNKRNITVAFDRNVLSIRPALRLLLSALVSRRINVRHNAWQ